MLNLIVFIKH